MTEDQLRTVNQRLDSIDSAVHSADKKNIEGMTRMEGRIEQIETTTRRLDKSVTGNGSPQDGLIFQTAKLREDVKSLSEGLKDLKETVSRRAEAPRKFLAKVGWFLFGALSSGVALVIAERLIGK